MERIWNKDSLSIIYRRTFYQLKMYINLRRKRRPEPKGLEKFYDDDGEEIDEDSADN
jgi:hypothetical protein